MFEVVVV